MARSDKKYNDENARRALAVQNRLCIDRVAGLFDAVNKTVIGREVQLRFKVSY